MSKPSMSPKERRALEEFSAFVDAEEMSPPRQVDARVLDQVRADLKPPRWLVYGKITAIETGAGIATLFFCPQFGLGFGGHSEFFHSLHQLVDTFLFFVICGLIFIVLGGVLSGLLLTYNEMQAIRKSKYVYYLTFALLACLGFYLFGAEIALINAFAWVSGAVLGNWLGLGGISRVRFASINTR